MALRKPSVVKGQQAARASNPAADMVKRWPLLWEYLSSDRWEDGTSRETSTLLLLVDDGTLKACLNDRAVDVSCWQAGDSLLSLLDGLEASLASDTVQWRVRQQKGGRKKG